MSGEDRARAAAFDLIEAVERDGAYGNLAMPAVLQRHGLSGRDAAFATELAYGSLRMHRWYDAVIESSAKREIDSIDPTVRWALWLGVHQWLGMRVAAHAAVNETVELVRVRTNKGAAGFANAVMRRVTEATQAEWEARLQPSLPVLTSHPDWVVEALGYALAADDRADQLSNLLVADNAPARTTLAARPGLVERDDLLEIGDPTHFSPWGLQATTPPHVIHEVRSGTVGVQDEGSQLVAAVLAKARPVQAGERWLDACAGPGGKTAMLAGLSESASVTALELHPHRAELVRKALKAFPVGTVAVEIGDATSWGEDASFDRVLVDAPCTGLGALRRRPEARWRKDPADIDELATLQSRILDNAVRVVKPGGLIAYVTCSPLLEETRDQIAARQDVQVVDARPVLADIAGTAVGEWGATPDVQMWPHIHGTDAMYLALLQRPSAR
jgi:16S rRNA (cytosine967-C5)-methyltransferase